MPNSEVQLTALQDLMDTVGLSQYYHGAISLLGKDPCLSFAS